MTANCSIPSDRVFGWYGSDGGNLTVWHSAAASALGEVSQNRTISRAKRSAAMPGWAGWRPPAFPTPCAEACAPVPEAWAVGLHWSTAEACTPAPEAWAVGLIWLTVQACAAAPQAVRQHPRQRSRA